VEPETEPDPSVDVVEDILEILERLLELSCLMKLILLIKTKTIHSHTLVNTTW
jgi:hypothetical protein